MGRLHDPSVDIDCLCGCYYLVVLKKLIMSFVKITNGSMTLTNHSTSSVIELEFKDSDASIPISLWMDLQEFDDLIKVIDSYKKMNDEQQG